MIGLAHDLRYACLRLRREPGFAFVAILTIALGLGATTTLFSVAYNVLMKPLPWPDADRIVGLSESRKGHSPRVAGTITNATYNAWNAEPTTIEAIGGWLNVTTTAVIGAGGDATRLQTAAVTPSLFVVLKARPLRGRLLVDDDTRRGSSQSSTNVIVLSDGLWAEWFGRQDDAIGKVVRIGDRPMTVIGVMPREFAFPDRATRAWTPFAVPSVLGEAGVRRVVIFRACTAARG